MTDKTNQVPTLSALVSFFRVSFSLWTAEDEGSSIDLSPFPSVKFIDRYNKINVNWIEEFDVALISSCKGKSKFKLNGTKWKSDYSIRLNLVC